MVAHQAGRRLMAWAVSNARVEPKGNAIVITKQASGTAKIDPLMAAFNAVAWMSANPSVVAAEHLCDLRSASRSSGTVRGEELSERSVNSLFLTAAIDQANRHRMAPEVRFSSTGPVSAWLPVAQGSQSRPRSRYRRPRANCGHVLERCPPRTIVAPGSARLAAPTTSLPSASRRRAPSRSSFRLLRGVIVREAAGL